MLFQRYSSFVGLEWLAVFLLFLLTSCRDEWDRKLGERELEQMVAELYAAQALLEQAIPSDDTVRLAVRLAVLEKYSVTEAEFDSVMAYYSHYKADRLSVIFDRASKAILTNKDRYENLVAWASEEERDFGERIFFEEHLSLLVPDGRYPALVVLSPEHPDELYAVAVNDSIPAGSTLSISLNVRGLRSNPLLDAKTSLLFSIAHEASKQLPIEKSLIIEEPGNYTLDLEIPEGSFRGKVTLLIHSLALDATLYAYIEHIGVSYVPGKAAEESAEEGTETT